MSTDLAQPTTRAAFTRAIARHPLPAFLLWFFTVGQALAFAPVAFDDAVDDVPRQLFIVASTLFGLLLPALVITHVTEGPGAVRELLRRAVDVRVGARWYALALLVVPAVTLGIAFLVSGVPQDATPGTWVTAVVQGWVLALVLTFLPNNLWEEVAWTGFFQTRLQRRHTPVIAATFTALFFALQHVSGAAGGSFTEIAFLMAFLFVLVLPFRFLAGWVYNRTASLFIVGLIHGVGNATAGGSGFQDGLLARLYDGNDISGLAHLIAFFLIGLTVVAATRGRLGRSDRSA
jgi:membrane protease YdiL (CAAX protease family)